MFLYLFTWPCCLYSVGFNGNDIYHHKDNIRDREENYILVSLTGLGGIRSILAFAAKPKHLSLWLKRTLHQSYFWLVDSYVWGISDRP